MSNDACWLKMDKFVRRFFVSALLKDVRCGLLPCMVVIMLIVRLIVEWSLIKWLFCGIILGC